MRLIGLILDDESLNTLQRLAWVLLHLHYITLRKRQRRRPLPYPLAQSDAGGIVAAGRGTAYPHRGGTIMTMRRRLALLVVVGGLMGISVAAAASRPSGPAPAVVTVQVSLYVLGYDPGPIDGFGGPRTIEALTAYAQDRRIVLNQTTLNLVLELLHFDMLEEVRNAGGEGGREEPSEPRLLPIQRW
jgi:hypothetical protein